VLRRLGRRSWKDRDLDESAREGVGDDGDPLPIRGDLEYADEPESFGDSATNLLEAADEGVLGIMIDDMAATSL
jgi:hypothetical protein